MQDNKKGIPYESFPEVSKDFVNEVHFRSQSAMRAMEIFYLYRDKKKKDVLKKYEYSSICYISICFAISEIATLIDGRGNFSLKLSKDRRGKYSVQKERLRKLLPPLSSQDFLKTHTKFSNLIEKNSRLVDRILHTRHKRLAHASLSHYKKDKVSLSGVHFPGKKFLTFVDKFESIALETIFGVELSA